jgi:aminopeptidase N
LYFSGTKKGDVEYVLTDHESERARYWLACIDHPNIRTTFEFNITAAEKYTIVANGLLKASKVNADGTKTEQWQLQQVCPSYLCCFGVGEFVTVHAGKVAVSGSTPQMDFAYHSVKGTPEEDLKLSFGNTPEIMTWLEGKVGNPFPYPKYYQIAVPNKRGAMESIINVP